MCVVLVVSLDTVPLAAHICNFLMTMHVVMATWLLALAEDDRDRAEEPDSDIAFGVAVVLAIVLVLFQECRGRYSSRGRSLILLSSMARHGSA